MIPVRNDQTFLDLTVQQIEALNKQVRTEKKLFWLTYVAFPCKLFF